MIALAAIVVMVAVPGAVMGTRGPFSIWDGAWYLSVAEHGYLPGAGVVRPVIPLDADTSVDGAVAYFPLFPMLVAAVGAAVPVSLDVVAAALAFVFGAIATVAFGRFARAFAPDAADRSVLLFCFFPGAFVLSLAYSEGLLIALGCSCLLLLHRQRWLLAGIAAALASATRPNGLALAVACAVAAFIAVRRDRDWRPLLAPLIAPCGFLAFLGYLGWKSGEPLYWFRANEAYWHDSIGSWPELRLLLGGTHPQASSGASRALLLTGLAVGLVVLAGLIVLLFRARLPGPVVAYALAYEGLAMLAQILAPRPRLVFTAFPLVLGLGIAVSGRVFRAVLAVSGVTMGLLFVFYGVTYFQRPLVAP